MTEVSAFITSHIKAERITLTHDRMGLPIQSPLEVIRISIYEHQSGQTIQFDASHQQSITLGNSLIRLAKGLPPEPNNWPEVWVT